MSEEQSTVKAIDPLDNSPANIEKIRKHNAQIHKFIESMQAKIDEKKAGFIPEPQPREMTLAECNEASKKVRSSIQIAPTVIKIKPVVPQQTLTA